MYPDPLFSIGDVHVYAYGVCMAVGIIACFAFLLWAFSYKNFNEECTDKMLLLGIVATGIGILCSFSLFTTISKIPKKVSSSEA